MSAPRLCPRRHLVVAAIAMIAAAADASFDPGAWRAAPVERPPLLLVRGATVWTSGPDGVLGDADLLVRGGRIAAVGRGLEIPEGAVVIDAAGKHVTPGLIDAHSHIAVSGHVNELTDSVTAQVRIADVLDAESINIYRQLAGGVTVANIMHGSGNAIGGQSATIKLRWGSSAGELLFEDAAPAIKFALGENPKRSNWPPAPEPRYPQTRMGVEQVVRETFAAASDHVRKRNLFEAGAGRDRVPPRPDLQLDAIAEILAGERLVHAHSYRADEILMLMRVAEEFGFRVQCFQHVLEGYKVADELAAHGAGASTFSDWWAYKYEVVDAIPYNGALMHGRGVTVSFNSDSGELARRLNLEAAKAVRYGGLAEDAALAFVTINPARQLGIDDRVGSLEPGKDADFVLWSGHPLSTYSIVEQTWIEGGRYFDRALDLETREVVAAERRALAAKAAPQSDEEQPAPEPVDPGPIEDVEIQPEPLGR